MTKKDYVVIASALNQAFLGVSFTDEQKTRLLIELDYELKSQNPNYKPDVFHKAALKGVSLQ
jgi:hypothetical protein